jgi:hypothetical protein
MALFKIVGIDIWFNQILQNLGFSQVHLTTFYSNSQTVIALTTKISLKE